MRYALAENFEDSSIDPWNSPGSRFKAMEDRRRQRQFLEPVRERIDWRKDILSRKNRAA